MLTSSIVRVVEFCANRAWAVIVASMMVAAGASLFAATRFSITSDINSLLSNKIDWRQREVAFENSFRRFNIIEVVVEAPTPELAAAATANFHGVGSGGADFFQKNGILFQSKDETEKSLDGMAKAEPLIADLAGDRSLRGLVAGLEDVLLGLNSNQVKLDDLAKPFNAFSDALDKVVAGRPASFSWRSLALGKPPSSMELRGFIEVRPKLDYSELEPGSKSSDAIRRAAAGIMPKYQANARLTGPVAMADEEFGTIKENAGRNGAITLAIVLFILWLALRSGRLIFAVFVNLFVGLAVTAALGLLMIGSFNLISVYFAVLFVGIGVDFGIQYSVRYRAERHEIDDLKTALSRAAFHVGAPLTLAALATAAGFFSFLPTDYRGVSELGQIAGVGMLVAFATTVTLLPALIVVLNPPGEPEALGYKSLAPVDEFLARHRVGIIAGTGVAVVGALPLLYWLSFDFNPINLRDPKTESIATYLELSRDPATNTNAIEVLAPGLDAAKATALRVSKLPQVSHAITLASFIPEDQDAKLEIVARASKALEPAFDPADAQAAPTDADDVEALKDGAERLNEAANGEKGQGADAAIRLARLMASLAAGDASHRGAATRTLVAPLATDLDQLRESLTLKPITLDSLPADLKSQWIDSGGKARVEIAPKDDPGDNEAMRRFGRAVLAVEPNATEGPISIVEAGDTIVRAFIEAGFWAMVSIALLLWIVLRRVGDVLLTLIPLTCAGVVTLELCVAIGMPLNFANIIALPLLLGVGVAFKIYYIMAWREGATHLLQTSLTRAVLYSAMTTATAFGSLWFSSHPGTASMGKLLALSLVCTLAAAVLFQPILMGKPRADAGKTL